MIWWLARKEEKYIHNCLARRVLHLFGIHFGLPCRFCGRPWRW